MAGPSSISSALSNAPSHDQEAADLKFLFAQGFDIQTADHDLLNKFVIHRFNQYRALNAEDWGLWDCIRIDFGKFEAKYFDQLDSATWRVVRDYCYSHGFWIDHNFGPVKTCTTAMLKAVEADWNNKWTLEQIEWVEERYDRLSRTTRKRKQQLTGIPNLDSPSNPEPHTANSRRFSVEPQIQHFQDSIFQTPPQQPTMQPLYPALSKPSPYVYQSHQPQQPPKQPLPPQQTLYPAPEPQSLYKVSQSPERVDKLDTFTDENTEITGLLEKDVSKVVTPEEFFTPDKVVTPDEIPSDTQKGHPVIQAYNDKDKNLMLTQLSTKLLYGVPEAGNHCFAIYHPHYKEKPGMTESAHDPFLFRPPPQLLSLPGDSSDCVVKIVIHHPHYKDKLVGNLSTTFLFARDGGACDTKPGLVTKKGEPPRTSLHLLSDALQLLSFMLSLTLSKMRPAMFEYSAMFKCEPMSEWQSENLPEASFEPSLAAQTVAQTVEFSPDNIALLNKRLRRQTTNKSRKLRHVKLDPRDTHRSQFSFVICLANTTNKAKIMHRCKQVTRAVLAAKLYAMAHGLDIEKRHGGRYQIVRTKSHQHKHYGVGGMGKHEIGKYERGKDGTSEHWHLATFRKSCQCRDVRSGNVMLDL